ncbi:MAG: hypothetical protein WDO13_12990 [Verrucomicrobiota bacterium]
MQYVSFYLTPDQARSLGNSKEAVIVAGGMQYRFTPAGLATLHQYIVDVGGLAPASSTVVRSFYKWLGRLPSFFTIISMICEYVILAASRCWSRRRSRPSSWASRASSRCDAAGAANVPT